MRHLELIGQAVSPDGTVMKLTRRDNEYIILANGKSLMSSSMYGSEEALATLACRQVQTLEQPCVLSPEEARKALDELLVPRKKGQAQAAGWIGDAIYGVNDGLGAIFGIVSGVSGATLGNSKFVVIAGMVGMIASALSMGSGAYLAAKSEREIYPAEFSRERDAVEYDEAEAREVLSLSYQVRGLTTEEANLFVEHLARDKFQLVRALAQERLNTTEEGLRRPWTSAISGALSTAAGTSESKEQTRNPGRR